MNDSMTIAMTPALSADITDLRTQLKFLMDLAERVFDQLQGTATPINSAASDKTHFKHQFDQLIVSDENTHIRPTSQSRRGSMSTPMAMPGRTSVTAAVKKKKKKKNSAANSDTSDADVYNSRNESSHTTNVNITLTSPTNEDDKKSNNNAIHQIPEDKSAVSSDNEITSKSRASVSINTSSVEIDRDNSNRIQNESEENQSSSKQASRRNSLTRAKSSTSELVTERIRSHVSLKFSNLPPIKSKSRIESGTNDDEKMNENDPVSSLPSERLETQSGTVDAEINRSCLSVNSNIPARERRVSIDSSNLEKHTAITVEEDVKNGEEKRVVPNYDRRSSLMPIEGKRGDGVKRQGFRTILRTNMFEAKYTSEGSQHTLNEEMTGAFVKQLKLQEKAERKATMRGKKGFKFKGIHPRSILIVRWEFSMILIYILICFFVPFVTAFYGQGDVVTIVSYITSIIYFLDMCLIFSTLKFQPKEKKSMFKFQLFKKVEPEPTFQHRKRRKSISPELISLDIKPKTATGPQEVLLDLYNSRLLYFNKDLWIDLIAAMPWDLIFVFPTWSFMLLYIKFIRLKYFPQLVARNPYMKNIRRSMEEFFGIGQSFSAIFSLVGGLLAWLHLEACAIFILAKFTGFIHSPISDTDKLNESVFDQYTWCFFQAISNTFPVQYKPSDTLQIWFIIFFVILGALLYASILGMISSFSFGLDASGKMFRQKMDEVNEYMEWKYIPEEVRKKVRHYYQLKYRGKFFEEGTLLDELNDSLKQEISMHNCRELIKKVPFLNRQKEDGRDEWFFGRIATSLVACYYVKGDIICSEGETGSDMYFILQGNVFVFVNRQQVATLKEGQYFGEVAMIAQIPRTATIVAGMPCILYKLSRMDFLPIIREFEDVKEIVSNLFAERMAKVKKEEEERAQRVLSNPALASK